MAKAPEAGTITAPPGEAVIQRLRVDLVRFLARRTRDQALAEDLAQEALTRVLVALPRFHGAASLRTWARQIALNLWRDHLRRRSASPVAKAAAGDVFSVSALLDTIGPTPPAPDPGDVHDRQATHECLMQAARQLPPAEREVVVLHDLQGVPIEVAALTLGCSVGTAKVRLHRARRRLAQLCRDECVSDADTGGLTTCTPKRPSRRSDTVTRKNRS